MSKERYNLAEEMLAFWDWHIPSGEEYWSAAFYRLLGYQNNEIKASYEEWEARLHPDDKERVLEAVDAHFKDALPYKIDYRLRLKDGSYKWFRAQGSSVRDEEGNPRRMAGSLEDINNLKVRTKALRQTNEQLRQFAYAASHDLREPLRVIQGYAQLLETMELDIDPEAQSYIDWMIDGTQRMSGMIDDLLIYSRLSSDEQKLTTVSMYSTFDHAKSSLRQQAGESGAIINCCSNLPAVIGIKTHLQRLLQNLFSNAIKFSDPSRPPNIMLTVEKENGLTTFAVSDNGIGIKERHYKRIFNLFKRLHPPGKFEGTGMGLAICQKIIEYHGGQIWVESEFGKGSTFFFTLPSNDK